MCYPHTASIFLGYPFTTYSMKFLDKIKPTNDKIGINNFLLNSPMVQMHFLSSSILLPFWPNPFARYNEKNLAQNKIKEAHF